MQRLGSQDQRQDQRQAVNLQVMCNGLRGTYFLDSNTIKCSCSQCRRVAADNIQDMSPIEFERHAGMGASKKWKHSIKVEMNNSTNMTLGLWLEKFGPADVYDRRTKGSSNRGGPHVNGASSKGSAVGRRLNSVEAIDSKAAGHTEGNRRNSRAGVAEALTSLPTPIAVPAARRAAPQFPTVNAAEQHVAGQTGHVGRGADHVGDTRRGRAVAMSFTHGDVGVERYSRSVRGDFVGGVHSAGYHSKAGGLGHKTQADHHGGLESHAGSPRLTKGGNETWHPASLIETVRATRSKRTRAAPEVTQTPEPEMPELASWLVVQGGEKLRVSLKLDGIMYSGIIKSTGRILPACEVKECTSADESTEPVPKRLRTALSRSHNSSPQEGSSCRDPSPVSDFRPVDERASDKDADELQEEALRMCRSKDKVKVKAEPEDELTAAAEALISLTESPNRQFPSTCSSPLAHNSYPCDTLMKDEHPGANPDSCTPDKLERGADAEMRHGAKQELYFAADDEDTMREKMQLHYAKQEQGVAEMMQLQFAKREEGGRGSEGRMRERMQLHFATQEQDVSEMMQLQFAKQEQNLPACADSMRERMQMQFAQQVQDLTAGEDARERMQRHFAQQEQGLAEEEDARERIQLHLTQQQGHTGDDDARERMQLHFAQQEQDLRAGDDTTREPPRLEKQRAADGLHTAAAAMQMRQPHIPLFGCGPLQKGTTTKVAGPVVTTPVTPQNLPCREQHATSAPMLQPATGDMHLPSTGVDCTAAVLDVLPAKGAFHGSWSGNMGVNHPSGAGCAPVMGHHHDATDTTMKSVSRLLPVLDLNSPESTHPHARQDGEQLNPVHLLLPSGMSVQNTSQTVFSFSRLPSSSPTASACEVQGQYGSIDMTSPMHMLPPPPSLFLSASDAKLLASLPLSSLQMLSAQASLNPAFHAAVNSPASVPMTAGMNPNDANTLGRRTDAKNVCHAEGGHSIHHAQEQSHSSNGHPSQECASRLQGDDVNEDEHSSRQPSMNTPPSLPAPPSHMPTTDRSFPRPNPFLEHLTAMLEKQTGRASSPVPTGADGHPSAANNLDRAGQSDGEIWTSRRGPNNFRKVPRHVPRSNDGCCGPADTTALPSMSTGTTSNNTVGSARDDDCGTPDSDPVPDLALVLGGTTGQPGRAGRCAVCVIQRKGRCGSESAPKKCLRRVMGVQAPSTSGDS